jgi:hypothetical protein
LVIEEGWCLVGDGEGHSEEWKSFEMIRGWLRSQNHLLDNLFFS